MIWGQLRRTPDLPVSATAAVATATAGMTATTKSTAATGSAAAKSAARRATCRSRCCTASCTGITACRISATDAAVCSASSVCAANAVPAAISESAAQTVAGVTVETPVIPWAYTDEQTAVEPLRAVIAVRRAGIGVVRVIAPLASRRTVVHGRGNDFGSNANPDSLLSICCRCRERQSQKSRKQNQAKLLHKSSSCCPVLFFLDRGNGADLRSQHLPASGLLLPAGF
jgi:hypothetical protein